ncbi:hypothetical protein DSO57_1026827 [Entomophthora muscae]|uniref:Uncharacterized protein n=1 Tax=Entomophthora muscae TaxID=34485 RepID=A0ACC2RGP3_9FUNG|nr:hypothetical protein DSO57_1026827 [Entomophthora muscae]
MDSLSVASFNQQMDMGHRSTGQPPESNASTQLIHSLSQATVQYARDELELTEMGNRFSKARVVNLSVGIWEKIKAISNIKYVKLNPTSLFPDDAKTRALLKEVLNSMPSVELCCDIIHSVENIWALRLRFTILQLNLTYLGADDQIKLLNNISTGIRELRLILHEPNQKVLDTISTRFRILDALTINYKQKNQLTRPFPTIGSLKKMQITSEVPGDAMVFAPAKPFRDTRALWFSGIEFEAGLEGSIQPMAPLARELVLVNTSITNTVLQAHFNNITKLSIHLREGHWHEWAVARDLKKLRQLFIELPDADHNYSTSGFNYPQVTHLTIGNINTIDIPFWRWLAQGFPAATHLSLETNSQFPDQYDEIIPFRMGLPNLLYLESEIDLSPETYTDFIDFSPNIKELSIPAGLFKVHSNPNQAPRYQL